MWNSTAGVFCDYLWEEEWPSDAIYAATVFPLYFSIATEPQAHAVAASVTAPALLRALAASSAKVARSAHTTRLRWLVAAVLN